MSVVYLSGPMTGKPEFNFPAFNTAAATLRSAGHTVINPAELDLQDASPQTWEQYLRRDLAELVKCEVIALLPEWEDSRGARLEQHVAQALGMGHIYLGHDL